MQIYKLTSSQTNQVYVGKTKDTLKERLKEHKSDYRRWLNGTHTFCSSYFIIEYDDCKIELIEKTNNSLREIHWIQKLNTCNFNFNGDYFITEHKNKRYKQGFIYIFQIERNKTRLIEKRSTNKEYLIKVRDEWIKNNQHVFIEE